jgi:hypothetical protein
MATCLLLSTLAPDVQQAIVWQSCLDMHSRDADDAAYAQDTAAALRLTCRTLRAAVDANVRQLTMRAVTSLSIERAMERFPGAQEASLL